MNTTGVRPEAFASLDLPGLALCHLGHGRTFSLRRCGHGRPLRRNDSHRPPHRGRLRVPLRRGPTTRSSARVSSRSARRPTVPSASARSTPAPSRTRGSRPNREFEITEFEPPTKIRWTEISKNQVTATEGGYDLAAEGGGTRVTIHNVLEGHGIGKLFAPLALRSARKGADDFAARSRPPSRRLLLRPEPRFILAADATGPVHGATIWGMRSRRGHLRRLAASLIPWAIGMFLILAVFDEADRQDDPTIVLLGGLLFALVQAIALVWRRSSPERATAVVLAAGLGFQLLYPQMVVPFAGLLAIGSLAAQRPRSVSLVGLAALLVLAATNFFTTTVEDTVFTMGLAVGAWALGDASRNRRLAQRRGGAARDGRGAGPHRARAARRDRAQRVADRRPGRRRRRRLRRRAPTRPARRSARSRRPGARRWASCAGCSAPCGPATTADRRRAPARPRSARRAGRAAPRRRPRRSRSAARATPRAAARRRRPVRLPHRPGGADQHAAARRAPRGPR